MFEPEKTVFHFTSRECVDVPDEIMEIALQCQAKRVNNE